MHVMERLAQVRNVGVGLDGFIRRYGRASIEVAVTLPPRRLLVRRTARRLHRR